MFVSVFHNDDECILLQLRGELATTDLHRVMFVSRHPIRWQCAIWRVHGGAFRCFYVNSSCTSPLGRQRILLDSSHSCRCRWARDGRLPYLNGTRIALDLAGDSATDLLRPTSFVRDSVLSVSCT
jgi:hypothetical protein